LGKEQEVAQALLLNLVGKSRLEAALEGREVSIPSGFPGIIPSPCLRFLLAVLRGLCAEGSRVRPNARTFTILLAAVGKAVEPGPKAKALCTSLYQEALQQVRPPLVLEPGSAK
jgi:hypothetical protein